MTPDGSAIVGHISDAGVDFSPYLWTASGGGRELVHRRV